MNGESISSLTPWLPIYTYYITDWVSVDNTLTIPAGTVVKFGKGAYLQTSGDDGVISVTGTEENPVIFTSCYDNVGIAIPEFEGSTTKAAKGDWKGVHIESKQGSVFNYAEFRYANDSALKLNTNSSVTNCLFTDNKSDNEFSGALTINDNATESIVTNNTFYNNDWPIKMPATYSVSPTNSFHKPDNTAIKNKYQAISVSGGKTISQGTNVTWNVTEIPYFINTGTWVNVAGLLSVGSESGSVAVKLNKGYYINTSDTGKIYSIGTEEFPVIFTSYCDNSEGISLKEFTGEAVNAEKGDWGGIEVTSGSKFEYTIFRYSNEFALIATKKTTVKNCIFTDNKSNEYFSGALIIEEDANDSIVTNNKFYNNDWPLEVAANYTVDTSNIFHDPDNEDIKNEFQAIVLDAGKYVEKGKSVEWMVTEIPYFVAHGTWVSVKGRLDIGDSENDVIVKFNDGYSLENADSGIITLGAGSILTSWNDDANGGDIDKVPSEAEEGSWEGVTINGERAYLDNPNVKYDSAE